MNLEEFIARWAASGDAERANKDTFLVELCDVLEVPRPEPKTGDPTRDGYVFEKDVARAKAGGPSIGFVDLYKHGCFLLEAKQYGTLKRDSPAWNLAISKAHGQALGYATHLDEPPPFLLVIDIGHSFDLYASFDGTGAYRPFPDGLRKRFFLRDLAAHVETLRAIWTTPHALDPAQRSAKVTREVAAQIALLARALEGAGHTPERVATFLMRCLFTMFAEDVGLLPDRIFTRGLADWWIPHPPGFAAGVASLWSAMDTGGNFVTGKLKHFNGGLFADHGDALPLDKEQLELLQQAAKSDWSQVDPSIFGTLLERALDPKERHRLGAHYTPRAYVERLIRPTIEEPLRGDWDLVRAEVRQLVEAGKEREAQERVLEFHHELCRTRVLDPACGTGNFLYVTLDLFKRLESEVLALLAELGYAQIGLEMQHYRVTPEQFLGLEKKRWAKEIAELVLWIGYLQWQVRQASSPTAVPEPVLRDYGNVQCRDAVLTWDAEELVRDEQGVPVTRWDGETMKPSPVTGEPIPDETARVPVYRYTNPKPAEWPKADFIVGNPPFQGNWKMRQAFGDGYAEALRGAYPEVPNSSDYVLYWWHRAAERVIAGDTRRFGLITTNSISQALGRRVIERSLLGKGGHLVFAVPDHPWVENQDGAAVRVAMTAGAGEGEKGKEGSGVRSAVVAEVATSDGDVAVKLEERRGVIYADLTVGVDVTSAVALQANENLSSRGVSLHGAGFIVTAEEAQRIGLGSVPGLEAHIRPYLNGKDLTSTPRGVFVIDLFGLSESDLRNRYPSVYQHVLERVKPERDHNNRAAYRDSWWIFGEPRANLRPVLAGLPRFIATVETSKHRLFLYLDSSICPDNMLVNIGLADAYFLGVLSSRTHVAWALAAGGTLEDRPRYNKTRCFDPFPFPVPPPDLTQKIRDLGEALDAHRKRQQAAFPSLTLTGMYNVLEKLRSGEPLEAKERVIHEQGLVSVLKEIHDELDAAVFGAYGWPAGLTDEEILERLVALNKERAAEEAEGLVRWLRPEFQNPAGARAEVQGQIEGLEIAPAAPSGKPAARLPWPKNLPDRVVAVRDLLTERGELTSADLATRYKGVRGDEAEKILESLAAVGLAIESVSGGGAARSWRGLR